MKRILGFIIASLLLSSVHGQVLDNRQSIWVVDGSYMVEDTLIIDPSSLVCVDKPELNRNLSYDAATRIISLYQDEYNSIPDSVRIRFRVLRYFPLSMASRSMMEYDSAAPFKDYGRTLFKGGERSKLFETGEVATSGRLSRGITVGNSRDLLVNSSLNLTMDGKLDENLFIRAAITDQSVPYQPEGNTAQLQDFDNVYVQLYNQKWDLTAGDIRLTNAPNRFLKYNKNVQGALLKIEGDNGDSFEIGASIAKGKFASVKVDPIDGVSGPYRIPGPNGEDFVVVLATSEKVYLDGKLLFRGFDNDYIIDYNLGEVTFSSHIMITRFSRIRVDFEYADAQYDRTILSAGYRKESAKAVIYVNTYSEKDNKNQPNFELSNEDIDLLASAGDNPLKAVVSGADSVGYVPNKILYKKLNVGSEEIYKYSTNPDSANYEVKFSKVGPNKGDYTQVFGQANGTIYEWVPRVNNIPQGDFAPLIAMPVATKKQMVVAGSRLALTENESISVETAISGNDQNQFSPSDNLDNTGKAFQLAIDSKERPLLNSNYKFNGALRFEYLDKYFTPIDRFRDIEFDRDWAFDPALQTEVFDDALFNAKLGISRDPNNRVNYSYSRRVKGDQVNGYQQEIILNKEAGNFRLLSDLFLSNNDQISTKSDWTKLKTDFSYNLGRLRSGYVYSTDHNTVAQGDSIYSSANYYNEHLFYIRSDRNNKNSLLDLSLGIREDQLPSGGTLEKYSLARNLSLLYSQKISTSQNIKVNFIYRNVEFEENRDDAPVSNSLNGRLDWDASFWKNAVTNNLTYVVSNSRELQKEFLFIQVPTGEGNFNWVDDNEDGIKDLNEFFPAIHFDEKNFVKIFIPTGTYVEAFENTFNYRFNLRFPASWKRSSGIKAFFYKISNSTVWNAITKTTDKSISSRLLAFAKPSGKSGILHLRENFRSTWFFNRSNPNYGFNVGYKLNHFINLLTGGMEERKVDGYNVSARVNLSRFYTLRLKGKIQKEYSISEILLDRDYIVNSREVHPAIAWQPGSNLRLTLTYGYSERINTGSTEKRQASQNHEAEAEFRWSRIQKLNFQTTIGYAHVSFTGFENSAAGYAVLAGFKPGANLNWTLTLQQTLMEGLQLSLNYQGRKGEQTRVIHVGRVMVSALF